MARATNDQGVSVEDPNLTQEQVDALAKEEGVLEAAGVDRETAITTAESVVLGEPPIDADDEDLDD